MVVIKMVFVVVVGIILVGDGCQAVKSRFRPSSLSSLNQVPSRGGNTTNQSKNKMIKRDGFISKNKVRQSTLEEDAKKQAPLKIALGLGLFALSLITPEMRHNWTSWASSMRSAFQKEAIRVKNVVYSTASNIREEVGQYHGVNYPKRKVMSKQYRGGGTATIADLVFNLVKAIVGVGVLSLPAGILAVGNAPSTVIPAVVLVVVMGAISAIGFSLIAQVCAITGAQTYREAWAKTVSPSSSWIPTACALGKTFLACLSYSMVLADSLRAFVPIQSRTTMLWTVTAVVLLPLCWIKDLKSLVPFSIVGVLGMIYTTLAMAYRYLQGSYRIESPLLKTVPLSLQPKFGSDGWQAVFRPQSIVFVSMLSTAYMCHFNAPKFHRELKDNTIPRFNRLVALGFGIAIAISALVAGIGFATFGSACDGIVLNNYSEKDSWIMLSRIAISVSLICSYPISFQGLRDGVLDMVGPPLDKRSNALLNQSTLVLLMTVTILANILTDVSFLVAFGGATLGNLLVYIFPALMFGIAAPEAKVPSAILGATGVIFSIVGSVLCLQGSGGAH